MKQDSQRRPRQFVSGRIRRGGLAHSAQSLPGRFAGFASQPLRALQAPLDLSVELGLVVAVIRERGMTPVQRGGDAGNGSLLRSSRAQSDRAQPRLLS